MDKEKIPVGILGATGLVGRRFVELLGNHPWFEVACVAASHRSAGCPYREATRNRWFQNTEIPSNIKNSPVYEVNEDKKKIADRITFAFSALSADKEKVKEIENSYAEMGIPIVSNNSAHRWTEDVPMIMPEINPHHIVLIDNQRKNRAWGRGFIVVKPNCSIQSYVPVLEALKEFEPERVIISTYQAVSGAGKTLESWPEMKDNVIPFIAGEEKKSEEEPLKIWAKIKDGKLELAQKPKISTTCIRIPITDGHLASVTVEFKTKPTRKEFIEAVENFQNPMRELNLPSSPKKLIKYFEEEDRPQIALDLYSENGMGIGVGRLREDPILHWKFVALSHNTIRGAAGGAILTAELLVKKGYIEEI